MTAPTCPECGRQYIDLRGCDWHGHGERMPVQYGSERNPLSSSPRCRDCGSPKGTSHHAGCACTECPVCHGQWHGQTDCEADRKLTSGGPWQ